VLSRGESMTDTSADDDDVVTERGGGHRRCLCVDREELARLRSRLGSHHHHHQLSRPQRTVAQTGMNRGLYRRGHM